LLLCAMLFHSCIYEQGEVPKPIVQCDTSSITYTDTVEAIFTTNCAVQFCHDSQTSTDGVSLTTYSEVAAKVNDGRIEARMIIGELGYMPPAGKLPDSIITMVLTWIDEGHCE